MDAHRPDDEPATVTLFLMTTAALALHRQGWNWEEICAAFEALATAMSLWLATHGK